jgi:hypothetical protein
MSTDPGEDFLRQSNFEFFKKTVEGFPRQVKYHGTPIQKLVEKYGKEAEEHCYHFDKRGFEVLMDEEVKQVEMKMGL